MVFSVHSSQSPASFMSFARSFYDLWRRGHQSCTSWAALLAMVALTEKVCKLLLKRQASRMRRIPQPGIDSPKLRNVEAIMSFTTFLVRTDKHVWAFWLRHVTTGSESSDKSWITWMLVLMHQHKSNGVAPSCLLWPKKYQRGIANWRSERWLEHLQIERLAGQLQTPDSVLYDVFQSLFCFSVLFIVYLLHGVES